MSSTQQTSVYDDLVELLAEGADPERLRSFRLSPDSQTRLDALLEQNRLGTLTEDGSAELDEFEHFEHLVRLLKARTLDKKTR